MGNADFITVVSGVPRSGTSLMMQMLHAGGMQVLSDHRRTADLDNPKGYFEFEAVKRLKSDQSWLPSAQGKAIKIIHLLLMDLPTNQEYRVVFMHRDLQEVVRSQAAMLQRASKTGSGLEPERLIKAYSDQLHSVFRWLNANPCFKVLNVEYRKLIEQPAEVSSEVATFLQTNLNLQAMTAAVDPSLYRNRSG